MIKMTGSGEILATTEADENILKNKIVLDYVSLMNPDSDMTLTINNGDPLYIPQGVGFTNADIKNLSRINKLIIAEDATNYHWHGNQVDVSLKV